MMENIEDKIRYEAAKKRLEKLKGFYIHLLIYVVINAFIIYSNYQHGGKGSFFEFKTFSTAFFWGIGILGHAASIFSAEYVFGSEWEERKIREIMDKDRYRRDEY